jgi:hypothetical protein
MMASRSGSVTKTKWLWVWVVLIVAVMIAGSAVVAASAQAVSKSDRFPKQVLMKGEMVLQGGKFNYANWH